ncbi:MAG: hypothetical protein ACT4PL_12135 [Phycisphaerales bacterium]
MSFRVCAPLVVVVLVVLTGVLSVRAGQAGGQPGSAPPTSPITVPGVPASKPVKPINTLCPIMGEEVDEGTPTVKYKGHVIGFCCPGCDAKWGSWTDAQRDAFVAKCQVKPAPPSGEGVAAAVVAAIGSADSKALDGLIDQHATITIDSSDQGRWSAFRSTGLGAFNGPLAVLTLKVERAESIQLAGAGAGEVVRVFGICQAGPRTVSRFAMTLVVTGAEKKVAHLHWVRTSETAPAGPGQPMR